MLDESIEMFLMHFSNQYCTYSCNPKVPYILALT